MAFSIRIQETGGKKIYVGAESREGIFLYPGEIKKLKLHDGDCVSEEEFEQIRKEYAVPRAKKRALGILVKRDCTERELRDKLTASVNDSLSVEDAVRFVKSHGYVNDESYARDYIAFKKGKKSYRLIKAELSRKGIDGQLLDILFEEAGSQKDEDIRPHVQKYIRKFDDLDREARQKTCAYFYRKGYAADAVLRIMDEIDEMR